jgi:hypothetical protein
MVDRCHVFRSNRSRIGREYRIRWTPIQLMSLEHGHGSFR